MVRQWVIILLVAGGLWLGGPLSGGSADPPPAPGRWQVMPFAGDGRPGVQDGAPETARLNWPTDVVVASDWTVYVADFGNHRIRKIAPDGVVSTLAGGRNGFADGTGTAAMFSGPNGLTLGPDGNVYVADAGNARIRRVTPAGVVTTVAGDGVRGVRDGPGATARFVYPTGLAFAPEGTLFVVDRWAHMVRAISPDGQVRVLAGNGTPGFVDGPHVHARFDNPLSIAWDDEHGLVVTDPGNRAIRTISRDSVVHTLAGTPRPSPFSWVAGVAVDSHGQLWVTDSSRLQVMSVGPDGRAEPVAGQLGAAHDPSLQASFMFITGIALDPAGNLLVADAGRHQIHRLIRGGGSLVQHMPDRWQQVALP